MKLVHTADLHIGIESHGPINPQTGLPRRLDDFLARLDDIVDTAIDLPADLVVIAGDVYKSREPSPTHQRLFAQRVLRLSRAGIATFILAGNHDLPNAASRAASVDIFRTLEVPNVTVARSPAVYDIETAAGPVLVAALPWLARSTLLADERFRAMDAAERDVAFVEGIARLIDELAGEVESKRMEPHLRDAPAILAAHLHALEGRDGAERMLTVGNDPMIPLTRLANPTFDYVALGHLHAHQVLATWPQVVYPGSIERVNFGEERETKGYVVATLQRGDCQIEFRELAARRFLTIDVNAQTDDPTELALRRIERHRSDIEGSVVRLRIKLSAQNHALFDESAVRASLADAFWVAEIQREMDRPARARLAGTTVEGKRPIELLDDYFRQKELPEDERVRLRVYAQRLLTARSPD